MLQPLKVADLVSLNARRWQMRTFRRFLHNDWCGRALRRCVPPAIATVALFLALPLVAMPPTQASAQGFFDFLFGQRPAPGPSLPPLPPPSGVPDARPQANQADPLGRIRPGESITNSNTGRVVAYCVRLCDGRYFPLERHATAQPARLCSAFCPGSATKVFNGSVIEFATAADGGRYGDLKTAFLYRKKLVDNCTCNGRDAFGLAAIDIDSDPTLRTGDTVTTTDGTQLIEVIHAPSARGATGAVPANPDPNRIPGLRGAAAPAARPN
jgi:Protein of unknown function (DUF2865)